MAPPKLDKNDPLVCVVFEDSYNHFVHPGPIFVPSCSLLPLLANSLGFAAKALRNVKMKQIVKAASNNRVTSESDKNWFLQYENIRVGKPSKTEDMIVQDPRPH